MTQFGTNRDLQRVIEGEVSGQVVPLQFARSEETRVLARAIIVDCTDSPAASKERLGRSRAERAQRAATEVGLTQSRL